MSVETIKAAIRDVADFPKKGIVFKDITPLLGQGDIFREAVNIIAEHYKNTKIEKIVAVESRGFILGAAIAYKLRVGMIPVRKKGKLPYKTVSATYQLEYGTDTLEMHEDAISPNQKVLVVDDLLATGGTAQAVCELTKKLGGQIVGVAFLIELAFLNGRDKLKDQDVFALIKF